MLKTALTAALIVAAFPAVAQQEDSSSAQPQPATPPEAAAIQQAAMAFGQCVSAGMQSVDATAAPEAGAAGVLGACSSERERLEQAAEAMIATMPDEQQAAAREQLRSQLGDAETQIAAAIRRQREAPAAAPTE
jgi:hypothetical protein